MRDIHQQRAARYLLALVDNEPDKAVQAVLDADNDASFHELLGAMAGYTILLLRLATGDNKEAQRQWAMDQILANS